MQIKYIEGDLLDFPEGIQVACHQANCQATMGAGIALQVRERYPEVAKADRDAFNAHEAKLGLFSAVKISDDPVKIIVNLYGQETIGGEKATDYEGLYQAMSRAFLLASNRGYKIGLPRLMGCGLAGGDWRIVKTMIEVLAEKHNADITIVELKV